jgi:hypothetical protein
LEISYLVLILLTLILLVMPPSRYSHRIHLTLMRVMTRLYDEWDKRLKSNE